MAPGSRFVGSPTMRGALAGAVLAIAACARPTPTPAPAPGGKPTLLVFITVDQFRPAYLEEFEGQLHGGLARLVERGAFFTNAHQDYAITETAPGHASTMSGRFPRSTGITRNVAGVNDPNSPLLESKDPGASPFRFRGTTLTDWLTAADPATRALSISAKDRGAILPIGRRKEQVFWYTNDGKFTTSRWYADTLPAWVTRFNATDFARRWAGRAWVPLLDAKAYPEPDSVRYEVDGKDIAFPHTFPADSDRTALLFRFTPLVDEVTAHLALAGLQALDLGRGPSTDVLAVSLSATDYVGHFYGPESREQHDQILRLDRLLGGFLDTLFTLRDSTRIVIALTADHGGTPIPELHGKRRVSFYPLMDSLSARVQAAGGDRRAVDFESGALFVDPARLGSRLPIDEVVSWFVTAAKRVPGVMRVDRFADLAGRDTTTDYIARRWLHMFSPDVAPLAVVTLEPGNLYFYRSNPYPYPIVASHGSPHPADSHVPIILVGPRFKPGRYDRFVVTADIAPTLARALGVSPTERLDGRPLAEAFIGPPYPASRPGGRP